MRIKIRSPTGTQVLNLSPEATVSSLLSEIRSKCSISGDMEIKYGYPPKILQLNEYSSSSLLEELPVKLEGEQLIISESGGGALRGSGSGVVKKSEATTIETEKAGVYVPPSSTVPKSNAPFSFAGQGSAALNSSTNSKPLSLSRSLKPKINKDDPPDVPLKNGRGTVMLRVMEDDNSCLFRAISYVMTNSMYSVEELRQLVASTIQEDHETYSEAVLEQKRDAYCEWITMDSSWGGGIELGIFANFFDMEICTIDVSTNDMIRFNEGKSKRAFVVYSGIHYDALVLSPAGSSKHDSSNDIRIFDSNDDEMIEGALELCRELRKRKYFTDTKNFAIKCNICGIGLKGEKSAVEHATKTGHSDFGEF
ncbi:uncharacterized protein H6S33_013077 [Morchella sextelata]|uniref:uncharacterized protein n=1 Tax=Morchella sextelata TaxID=1174677 RepID=UPI001D03AB1A|nr:uncharacterized protein H6S33_013077 [Morchella sextelata]KAH0609591.1 hypothetical protein H6S33_013077 [Morchella sextelata]